MQIFLCVHTCTHMCTYTIRNLIFNLSIYPSILLYKQNFKYAHAYTMYINLLNIYIRVCT